MRAAHLIRGKDAESNALTFLKSKGLRLLEKNYRSRYGEIDLVMMDGQDLVFVEVRYRKTELFGGATQSVDFRKQLKIRHSAQAFLQKNLNLKFEDCRFDVIAVSGQAPNYSIDWIDNAFE